MTFLRKLYLVQEMWIHWYFVVVVVWLFLGAIVVTGTAKMNSWESVRWAHWVGEKLFPRCWLPFFLMFVYILDLIGWYFFSRASGKKVEDSQLSISLIFSSRVLKYHVYAYSVLKSGAEILTEWRTSFDILKNRLKSVEIEAILKRINQC